MTSAVQKLDAGSRNELSVKELYEQVQKIQAAMKAVMKEGEHYGKIPGTDKNVLYKSGSEKLMVLFRLDPQYDSTRDLDHEGHLSVHTKCTLYHITTGQRVGSGEGMCSTRESKYAYRNAQRVCPKCGSDKILKSKYPPKDDPDAAPGWYCFAKKGGCGAEFAADDEEITSQQMGRIPNPDLPDLYNTVLKMSNKRALVAAVLNVTAASDIFTQDLEDLVAEKPAAKRETIIEADEVERMVQAFESVSVTTDMIEAYIGHSLDRLTSIERNSLRKIHSAMLDGNATWEDCTGNNVPEPAEKVRAALRKRKEQQHNAAAGGE